LVKVPQRIDHYYCVLTIEKSYYGLDISNVHLFLDVETYSTFDTNPSPRPERFYYLLQSSRNFSLVLKIWNQPQMEKIGVENGWLVVVGSQSYVILMIVFDFFAGADDGLHENDDVDDATDDENYD